MVRKLQNLLFVFGLVLVSSCAGLWNPPSLGVDAQKALISNEKIEVVQDETLQFLPKTGAQAGFIFYPGAYVPPAAYAVELRQIAEAGYLVIVPKMPFNLAVYNPNVAQEWIENYPEIEEWAIGGHSLGGAMAGQFVFKHPDAVEALIFWASYPPKSDDLSNWDGQVTSISASLDGLSTPDKVNASRAILPSDANFIVIEGGNHAQFGDYGAQKGDNPATISKEEQWAQITEATLNALDALNE